MSDAVHLLVPFASSQASGCVQALRTLALPQLEKLLARLALVREDRGDERSLSMPHERVLARECGLGEDDGRIPWAAWQVHRSGREAGNAAWARITPCHWRVGTDHIAMGHPQALKLDGDDSQALLATMRPFFQQDGIALEYDAPTLWLAQGELFRNLATASLDRVVGRVIDEWMPRAAQAKTLRRLQQEMQMLLYTHEVNEIRLRGGLLPVNSFWVSGTGALPSSHAAATPRGLHIIQHLRDAAMLQDWRGWATGWEQLDSQECARLVKLVDGTGELTLTLCGERNAQTWSSTRSGTLLRRIGARAVGWFGRRQAAALLETL
jgi:hypothetical protein